MNYSIGDIFSGFEITAIRKEKDFEGTLVEMIHRQTGAKLFWMDNGELNKLFCVTFKTVPENSTGVFHILEHSVLCGSDKYPVREPFVELLKSSMNTFLNAMTYPDKTVYPVSSRNELDFLNLTETYLDAVFAPALLHNPNIFYQEGHHTEIGENPAYVGVVLNEMKGAMSGVDSRIDQDMGKLLFPDTCYRFNSGGEPDTILDLTYDQFVETYKRFYHPSNAQFYLDGNLPLEKTLALINSYLSGYTREENLPQISFQRPISGSMTSYYDTTETAENRDYLAFGKVMTTFNDTSRITALSVLCYYLASTNESPLKKAILSASLAEDVELRLEDGLAQPYLILVLRNTDAGKIEQIKQVISDTLSQILQEGLPEDDLIACINRAEFAAREKNEPQALYRLITVLNSTLYGGDPTTFLMTDSIFAEVRESLQNGNMLTYLREACEKENWCTLTVLPSSTLGEELAAAEQERLKKEIASLSDEQVSILKQENENLALWQQTPDSKEALETLPVLPLSEVDVYPAKTETVESLQDGIRTLFHPLPCCGILYVSFRFKLTGLSVEDIQNASIMTELFGEIPTKQYDVATLNRLSRTYIGSLQFRTDCTQDVNDTDQCTPYISVHASVLPQNLDKALEIISEILLNTDFSRSDLIRDIVAQMEDYNRQVCISDGHILAVSAVRAPYSAINAFAEITSGVTYTKFIRELNAHFEERSAALAETFFSLRSSLFCKQNLLISITGDATASLSTFVQSLPEGHKAPESTTFSCQFPKKLGIAIPGQISYSAKGYHLKQTGIPFGGDWAVLSNIVTLSHLWVRVRVQNGAYGTGMSCRRSGDYFCYSYRDPNPAESLNAFDSLSEFIKAFAESGEEDLDKFIISSISSGDPLVTSRMRGAQEDGAYLNGYSYEERVEVRRQMLATTRESLLSWLPVLEAMERDGVYCVVGPKAVLEKDPDLTIIDL